VLITGVAGGVGSAAAQAAIALGAVVIGTASGRHAAYLRRLGVSEVIDYTRGDWAQRARAAAPQIVLDTVGADTAPTAFALVGRGGTFVGTHDYTPQRCAASGVTCPPGGSVVGGPVPTALLLHETAELARSGKLTVHVNRTYPLAQAAAAQEFNRKGHKEGKVVLAVSPQASSH
jgi:NADPH:quinone reductase-like Zn-dependent oxidoreductase